MNPFIFITGFAVLWVITYKIGMHYDKKNDNEDI